MQRDGIGNPRVTDGAEQDRVEGAQPLQTIGWHHVTVLQVVVGTPFEARPLDVRAVACKGGIGDGHGGIDYFGANAVTGNEGNAWNVHVLFPLLVAPAPPIRMSIRRDRRTATLR